MNHVLKSRFVPWSSASPRHGLPHGEEKVYTKPINPLYSMYLLARSEKSFSMII